MDKQAVINALRNTAQSASNTIANGVSAPIDTISNGLKKVGVPMPSNPVGGSEWMGQQGLTREVPQGMPKLAGEAIGMIAPIGLARPVKPFQIK